MVLLDISKYHYEINISISSYIHIAKFFFLMTTKQKRNLLIIMVLSQPNRKSLMFIVSFDTHLLISIGLSDLQREQKK